MARLRSPTENGVSPDRPPLVEGTAPYGQVSTAWESAAFDSETADRSSMRALLQLLSLQKLRVLIKGGKILPLMTSLFLSPC